MSIVSVPTIEVPPDEVARQAEAALLGYGYQLYQTVSAWLSLKPSELLHVEFAEDFAVSDDGLLELTQIKNTKASLSLRSKAVSALIKAVWAFQVANPERSVVAALITTGKIGREKGLSFPGRLPGLGYWRVAAREGADVEPIRAVLLGLDLPPDLLGFLKEWDAVKIRDRILRPIRWLCSGPSQDEIERDLHDRLVHFGNAQGVGAQDSKNALNALIVELLRCVGRPAASRFVTAADLLTIFQKNTYRLVPPSSLQEIGLSSARPEELNDATLSVSDAISIPLPPRAARRLDIVESLHRSLVASGVLWLHGSSGLGKTTLALLLARRQNATWNFSDLRGLKPRTLRLVLARLQGGFGSSGARGLILDDLPADVDNSTILAIRRVARTVADADGLLIVTASKSPPPTLSGGLSLPKEAVQAVPYLTEEDVGEIVRQASGDWRLWGRAIFLSCGGHPQLVDARVIGLRQRGWPIAELREFVPLQRNSADLEDERAAVRARLLRELDVDSRELLLRLSLLINHFDRGILFAASSVSPAVAQAGMLFDALVGPWIEQVGQSRYRLSPLLNNSGEVGLAKAQRARLRASVVEYLLGCRPFPADQLLQVFIFAFDLKLLPALKWFSGVLAHAATRDTKLFKRLAEEVSVFAFVDRGKEQLLLPDDVHISVMLRYAQLRVAIAIEDGKRISTLLDQLLFEVDQLTGAQKSGFLLMALGTALAERSVLLSPARWMNMLQTLTQLPETQRIFKRGPARADPFSGLTASASADEMLFIMRATSLAGIEQLCELVEVLDATSPATRERYLKAASNLSRSVGQIVASGWLSSVRTEGFDGNAAAAKLAVLSEIASRWENADMSVELACAQAVMLDEYAGDKAAALEVLRGAQSKHPEDYRINRQRQKVYFRNGDHALALAEFESFSRALPTSNPVDRAFALREAGRSAAEVGEIEKTRVFFEMAWESASECGDHMRPMKAGLSADCAILDFQAHNTDGALVLMLRALEEAESIDPQAGLREHYINLIIMAAILWMRGADTDWPAERQAMVIGMCSEPNPLPELKERPLPQPLLPWYELAELEAEVSSGQVIFAALRKRTSKGGLLPMETMLASRVLQSAVRDLNVDRFLDVLDIYPRAVVETLSMRRDPRFANVFAMPMGLLKPIAPDEWSDLSILEATSTAVLIFLMCGVCSGRPEIVENFRSKIREKKELEAALVPLLVLVSHPSDREGDMVSIVASLLGRMAQIDFVFDAADAFGATVRLVQFLSGHVLGEVAAGPIFQYFANVWRDILTNRTFSVRNPTATGPYILASISKGGSNRARLANLVLASEPAVRKHMSDDLREIVRVIAQPRRIPLNGI